MAARATRTGRVVLWVTIAAVGILGVAATLTWLYVRGGGPLPRPLTLLRPASDAPLERSSQAEQVLRTLRLVGVDRSVAGSAGGTAIVRIELPVADSAGDVAAGWQAGLAALRDAYPRAGRYVVQLYGPGASPLLEMAWDGDEARSTDDPARLRASAGVAFLSQEASR